LTDAISDLLLVSEPAGVENLRAEGITGDKVRFVGNVMIDTLLQNRDRADRSNILDQLGLTDRAYVVVTLHRPSNVDEPRTITAIMDALVQIAAELPVVFPIHPRTHKNLAKFGLDQRVAGYEDLRLIEPLGYLDFLKLMAHAAVVLTDSGGMQEETTILGVPCMTLRRNTERPITVSEGTNRLVAPQPDAILAEFRRIQALGDSTCVQRPALWDGQAAQRIAAALIEASAKG